ncbi:MAG: hypothetical protein HKO86_06835 [Gammaproteobacteria bacterium]|nr:hypothetical protein [Gammaproteobacteria bacterium]NNL07422.1 hypothetical protein [Gammaproteobacteria bacterium]
MLAHKPAIGVLVVVLLTACESSQTVRDEDSQYYSVPLGSTFALNTGITIQPDNTSVYLQFGNIETVGNIDFYKPHCKFELYTISEQARQVEPDTFTVTRIVDQREDVSLEWPRYAALAMGGYDGPVHLTYSTTMYLDSKMQPDVFRMTCKRWDWPATGEYLSINEMRQALGDYFTLTLAE